MTDKDKENQDELFIFDSKEMDKLKVEFNKRKKEHKKQIKKERIKRQTQINHEYFLNPAIV